jgi:hypothetical protein
MDKQRVEHLVCLSFIPPGKRVNYGTLLAQLSDLSKVAGFSLFPGTVVMRVCFRMNNLLKAYPALSENIYLNATPR